MSQDKRLDRKGRILVEFIEKRGWCIYNRVVQKDEEKEYTFTGGRRNTVIDYIIGDIEVRNRVIKMTVVNRVDSDHHPMEVWLEGDVKGKKNGGKSRKCWRGVWDKEGRNASRQKVGRVEMRGRKLDENWKIMEEKVKRAIEKIERKREKRMERRREWWNEECEAKRREVRKN